MPTTASPIPVAWLQAIRERRQATRLSRDELEALQLRKFRNLVAYVQKESPYYREIIEDRDIDPGTCHPEDFPVLTKREVCQNFDRIITVPGLTQARIADFLANSTNPNELLDNAYHVVHTSGTSGEIGYYVFSRHEWIQGASPITHLVRPGWRKRIAYVAATRGHFAGVTLMFTAIRDLNWLFYDLKALDANLPIDRIIHSLNQYRPRILCGYTAMMKVLASAREEGDLRIRPSMVICGGEPMSPADRDYLTAALDSPVANVYASSEHLYMGMAFPGQPGMQMLEDNLMFELKSDHVRVTNLFNYTLPLIRYRMDDTLIPDLDSPRQSPFIIAKEIVGRYEDALEFTNCFGQSDFIHPIMIVELYVKGLVRWQIALIDETSFSIRAQFESGLTEVQKAFARADLRRKIEALLSEKHMENVSFDIQDVQSIAADAHSGKFRLVIQEEMSMSSIR